jgi:IS30 family transposase
MNNYNNTSNKRKNKHLNEFERGQIELLHKAGYSAYSIGKQLERASNTIRNEIRRGTVDQIKANKRVSIYYSDTGQSVYEANRKNCGRKYKLLKCEEFINYVHEMFFVKKHSLDSICGSVRLKNKFPLDKTVCSKTLYNYVGIGLLTIKNIDLPIKTKRSNKGSRIRTHKKILGTSISERPEYINDRSEFGHWEIDTVIGKKNKNDKVMLTMTERMTRKEIIRVLPDKTSSSVQTAIMDIINGNEELFPKIFKSITADNGSEFACLSTIETITNCKVYFAHPYSSGERGTNERHNGLIRRFIPKGKSINEYTTDSILTIQNWCNTLPRKILNYWTPDEIFEEKIQTILYN